MPMLYGAATGDGDSCYWYCTVQYIRCEGKYLGPGLCPGPRSGMSEKEKWEGR